MITFYGGTFALLKCRYGDGIWDVKRPGPPKTHPNRLGLSQEALGTLGDVSPGLGSQFITDHIRRFSPLPQDRDGLGAMLIDDLASDLFDQLFVAPVLVHARPTGVRMTPFLRIGRESSERAYSRNLA